MREAARPVETGEPGRGAVPGLSPLIVEEKPICRTALGAFVQACGGYPPAEYAASLAQALTRLEAGPPPPLLVVDLFTIDQDFDGLARLIAALGDGLAVAVDDRMNLDYSRRARLAGARGYCAKDFELEPFRAALTAIIGGGRFFPDEPAGAAPARGHRARPVLSARQLAVLREMAVGKANREIAEALNISPGTVKLHIHAILKLTGARNRTEAALIASRFLAAQPWT